MGKFDSFLTGLNIEVSDPRKDVPKLKILLYGPSGTGKTSLASTASTVEELSPVLYVDLERGTAPAAKYGSLGNMLIIQPATYKEFADLLVKISDAEDKPFNTVVIDTVDRLQELIKLHFAAANPRDSFAMWAAAYDKVLDLVNTIAFDLGLNILCITHESREVLETERLSQIAPDFEGKKSFKKLPSIFDIIGRMTWEDVGENGEEQLITVLTVKSTSSILTKTRFDNMPPMIGNPSFDKIMKWVHEHYDITEKN